jgi:choline-sulfatase
LYDYVRLGEHKRPFCLTVSLTHPHDPYAISQDLWDQYDQVEIPMPKVTISQVQQDPHSQRLLKCIDLWDNPVPEEAIRRARRAYYAACTYVDNQVGKLLAVLKACSLDKNTIVMFSGDHGDMLGERSLWYKMSWFESSARVPLIINYPSRFTPHRVKESVSTMDLLPTLLDMVGGNKKYLLPIDGKSLYPALLNEAAADEVFGEYMGEGTISPVVMIRRGRYKYVLSLVDPPQLFDLESDPLELHNLAEEENHATLSSDFKQEALTKWNLPQIHSLVIQSQRQRRICWEALQEGAWEPWDYQPKDDATKK